MKILIVDDESLNRFLLKHMLAEEGYHDCEEAGNGEEALAKAESFQPDIVLMDVMMPKMSGYEAATILKERFSDNYLPIIFITSLDDQDSLARCLEVGGDDFVSKPFDKVILSAKIKAHSRTRLFSKRIEQQNRTLLFHQQSVEREHAIVEHIFANAIVNNKQAQKYFDFYLKPAANFNGDLFLCEPSPNGGLYFLIGDFTGHGLASAIGALPVSRAFVAMTKKGLAVAEIATTINKTLLTLLPTEMFFVAAILEVDQSGKRFTVWNGGMPSLLIKSAAGKLVYRFESQHMALGILENHEFESQCDVFEANHGDTLLAYSDGLIEVHHDELGMLAEIGVEKWLLNEPNATAEKLLAFAQAYSNTQEQQDDITIVLFQCRPITDLLETIKNSTLPFKVTITLTPGELRREDTLEQVLDMLNSQQGMEKVRADLFTIMTEMYNNALEHGLLKLQSNMKSSSDGFIEYYEQREKRLENLQTGSIAIAASFFPDRKLLRISFTDSGEGFDVNQAPPSDNMTFGRGISLLRELCDKVEFTDGGRTTTVDLSVMSKITSTY